MSAPLAADTPVHIEAEVITALRLLSAARKLELARDMNRMADRLALAGLQRRQPTARAEALGYALALQRLTAEQRPHGARLLEGLFIMPTPSDPLALALRVGARLDAYAIPYLIVGSVAAVVHGEYRVTRDLDLVLNLGVGEASRLADALREDFSFLASDITDALAHMPIARADWRQRASFCAYDKTTGFQLDVYLSSGRPFEIAQFQRAVEVVLPGEGGGMLRVASAEDTVLAKLEWYKLSPSDRQWRDIQAIVRIQADALDGAYLRRWASELDLVDLLTWALSGRQPPPSGAEPRQQRLF